MKKQFTTLLTITLLATGIFATTSCSSDDSSSSNNDNGFEVVVDNLQGTINSGTVTLDATKTYRLTGKLVVENGATLRIPAGTTLIGTTFTSYIAVAQGGKIFVEGTATNPVVMTAAVKEPGKWGGLVICGKAPINKGLTASAEVSDLTYGGTEVSDNSGSIRYLRIEYAGYNYSAEKEFNGLSLFGVGNGTTIEYVQLHAGSDDGIEFFGGTVNTKYIVSTFNEDDQFDWTEGWNGTNSFWYSKQGLGKANRGIEADNNANNYNATPISFPTIENLTLIGLGKDDPGSENQAMKLRVGTKGRFNNVYIQDFKVGLDIQHDETISYIPTDLKISNVTFNNVGTKAKGKNSADISVNVDQSFTETTNASGAGNGANVPTWAQGWTVGL